MTIPAAQPRALLPCVCGCEDETPPAVETTSGAPPRKVNGVNGHPTKAKVLKHIDFSKVSRETTARLLIEARRLARG